MCYTVCSGTTYPFTITGDATSNTATSNVGTLVYNDGTTAATKFATITCLNDYLLIAGARDTSSALGQAADRYCGVKLNPATTQSGTTTPGTGGSTSSITVCSKLPSNIHFEM